VGYVVMRIAMVAQWLRAAREDRRRRATCLVYVATISVVQIGWVVLIFADLSIGDTSPAPPCYWRSSFRAHRSPKPSPAKQSLRKADCVPGRGAALTIL
jgi:Bacterial low temperature requirement A protein (LtrA)